MLVLSLLLVGIIGSCAQHSGHSGDHGHGHTTLHGICHNNHMQMTEDEVIKRVAAEMDIDNDKDVTKTELLLFFAELMGVQLDAIVDYETLLALDNALLLDMASGMQISKHDFTHAWHSRYHDSLEFVSATFDALESMTGDDNDGILNAVEIESIISHAMENFDLNSDGVLQASEMVTYLEHIYKNC